MERVLKNIYIACNLILTLGSFYLVYQDIPSFKLANAHLCSSSILSIYFLTLIRFGLFPFHFFIQIVARRTNYIALFGLYFPLPFVLIFHTKFGDDLSLYVEPLASYALVSSMYLCLVGFYEKQLDTYLTYLGTSLLTISIASFPYLSSEILPDIVYYMAHIYLSISAMALCVRMLKKRYGITQVSQAGGLASIHPILGYVFLFFAFVLSNMPLTMTFIGEEMTLHELYHHAPAMAYISLLIFLFWGISLYRRYIELFCGVCTLKTPKLPLLFSEKTIILVLILIDILSPFLVI